MTLLMMLLTTATAWADTGFNYIGADGAQRNTFTNDGIPDASVTVITSSNMPTEIGTANTTTWCVVTGIVKYTDEVNIKGTVNLILADECEMNMGTDTHPINGTAIWVDSDIPGNLTIYGQEDGTGNLTIYATGRGISTLYDGYITINGGIVNTIDDDSGIYTGNFTINGGTLITSSQGAGIEVDQNITINGGSINATGNIGIMSNGGNITITDGTVTIDDGKYGREFGLYASNIIIEGGTVTINSDNAEYDHDYGLHADGDIIIEGGTVTVSKNNELADDAEEAIHAGGTINITGGTVVANGYYYGIYSNEGDITIESGDVTATTIANEDSYGAIYAYDGDINISDGTINARGGDASIYAYNGDVTISGGDIMVSSDYYGIYTYSSGNIIINGGEVTANCIYSGIRTYSLNSYITINGGNITATATGSNTGSDNNCYAIGAKRITINGGEVTAIGTNSDGIYTPNVTLNGGIVNANGGNYGINIKGEDGSVVLNGAIVTSSSYNGTVKVAEGLNYTDGNIIYSSADPFTDEQKEYIAGETIKPSITGKEYESNYWTTFYTSSVGFTIDEAVNAYAYTAEVGTDNITLHLLGKVIPKQTAVIIVSESETITMSADAATNVSTVPENNLHGVDVATATSVITSELGQGTIFVLGKTTDNDEVLFGFHKYTGKTMPARKAFLLLNSNNEALARGISVVFDDDSTTGINAVNRGERIVNSDDAWFDLQGRKIQEPTQRGLYIHNGKKIVVK